MAEPAAAPRPGRSSALRFLGGYFLAYVVVATAINIAMGPPAMSSAFLDEYKAEYDRYVEISKDPAYRKWVQRPHLNEPDARLAERIAFMEEFEQNEALQAEFARRARYDLLLDFFNVFMVGLLIFRFARKPLANVLDTMAGRVAKSLDDAAAAQEEAAAREERAEKMRARLGPDKERIELDTRGRILELEREYRELTEKSLDLLEKETEDRKRQQEALALQALKRAMVAEAVQRVMASAKASGTDAQHAALVDDFVDQIEAESTP